MPVPVLVTLKIRYTKDSFLRALREVAPEMELFLENHGQYIKNFVITLIYIKSCTFRHFAKKFEKPFRHIFLRKLSPKHYFRNARKIR